MKYSFQLSHYMRSHKNRIPGYPPKWVKSNAHRRRKKKISVNNGQVNSWTNFPFGWFCRLCLWLGLCMCCVSIKPLLCLHYGCAILPQPSERLGRLYYRFWSIYPDVLTYWVWQRTPRCGCTVYVPVLSIEDVPKILHHRLISYSISNLDPNSRM